MRISWYFFSFRSREKESSFVPIIIFVLKFSAVLFTYGDDEKVTKILASVREDQFLIEENAEQNTHTLKSIKVKKIELLGLIWKERGISREVKLSTSPYFPLACMRHLEDLAEGC